MNSKTFLVVVTLLIGFSVLNYIGSYQLFVKDNLKPVDAQTEVDELSGEKYFTGDINNYREVNPYGSAFVGFDSLTDRGVSSGEMIYVQDVLLNTAMYKYNVFNGKISYVKDSFKKIEAKNPAIYEKYEFTFGLNNTNIHKAIVESRWLADKLKISIKNSDGREVFEREFAIYTD